MRQLLICVLFLGTSTLLATGCDGGETDLSGDPAANWTGDGSALVYPDVGPAGAVPGAEAGAAQPATDGGLGDRGANDGGAAPSADGGSGATADQGPGACTATEQCDNDQDNDCDGNPPAADADCFCGDGKVSGDETDVDCGGTCGACAAGKLCKVVGDCSSTVCQGPTPSGGCQQFETSRRVYASNGKLMVSCEYNLFGDSGTLRERIIDISGVTVSGGCQKFETSRRVYVANGKLMVSCEYNLFGDGGSLRDRVIEISGVTVSGGCEKFETSRRVYVANSKLMVSCEYNLFGDGGTLREREIALTGPATCR